MFINTDKKNKMMTYTSANDFRLADGTETVIKKRLNLIKGTTANNRKWSVSLIAGQVEESKSGEGTDDSNALSLVTLLQIGTANETAKGLFLGDATKATEAFLLKEQKSLIKDVDFVHIPHHGSLTSSSEAFVKTVNPKGAQVSHEIYESSFKLPNKTVIERWLKALGQKGDNYKNMIDYWEVIDEAKFNSTLANWKNKNYSIESDPLGTWHYLLTIPKGYRNDYMYINKLTGNYWGLFRKQTRQDLWGTGADDREPWKLPF